MPEHPASHPGSPRQLPLCGWGWVGYRPQALGKVEQERGQHHLHQGPTEGSQGGSGSCICSSPKGSAGKSPCAWSGDDMRQPTPLVHVSLQRMSQKPLRWVPSPPASPHLAAGENTTLWGSTLRWQRAGPRQQHHEADTICISSLQNGNLRPGEARCAICALTERISAPWTTRSARSQALTRTSPHIPLRTQKQKPTGAESLKAVSRALVLSGKKAR